LQYIELKDGDVIREGDELYSSIFRRWELTSAAGCRVGEHKDGRDTNHKYRRKTSRFQLHKERLLHLQET
jgi:hypothetical protein